jgi:hypothetical protein
MPLRQTHMGHWFGPAHLVCPTIVFYFFVIFSWSWDVSTSFYGVLWFAVMECSNLKLLTLIFSNLKFA